MSTSVWILCVVVSLLGSPARGIDIDCTPDEQNPSQQLCSQRGCSYSTTQQSPVCRLDLTYSQTKVDQTATNTKYHLKASKTPPFGGDFVEPSMMVEPINNNVVRIVLFDNGSPRFEVPYPPTFTNKDMTKETYDVQVTSADPFTFKVTRKATGTVLFDTSVGGLVLSDQFLQIVTSLASDRVFGFGENYHTTFKHNLSDSYTWPVFNRDQPPGGKLNTYGTQPFYVVSEDKAGHAHGVLILNSNAQEYSFSSAPTLTYRTIGGILDMYFFLGDSMEEVVQLYIQAIGLPAMPPYWGLGFHMSRYGFRSTYDVQRMVDGMVKHRIPFDAQYIDIDHFEAEADFTVNREKFPRLNEYFHELRANGINIVYLLDPCLITNMTNYQPYEDFKRLGANIKWPPSIATPPTGAADDDRNMLGWVWPDGKVIFPDFLQAKAGQLWIDTIVRHRNTLVFDGLWIDMNEPANFDTNRERAFNWPESDKPYWTLKCPNNTYDDPPYRPAAVRSYDTHELKARLSDKTLCMVGMQGDFGVYKHYDVHNLYGRAQAVYTQQAVQQGTGNRGLVLTRANFPGSGKYAGTWSGDDSATWDQLRASIVIMLEYNLFGMPYIGADICGFFGSPTPELCLRWHQLGAFYPFSRNHNGFNEPDQDPASFGPEMAAAIREVMETRYWLLPYMYTQFHRVHTQGGTVVRALLHEFPGDEATYPINDQFMWGAGLVVSPILYEGQNRINFYLPTGTWYDLYTSEPLTGGKGHTREVTTFSKPHLAIRGGHVIPMQKPANNTRQSRKNPLSLVVALSDSNEAKGSLFWDDGLGIDTYGQGKYYMATYSAAKSSLKIKPEHMPSDNSSIAELFYDSIDILGVTSRPGPLLITAGTTRLNGFVQDWDSNYKVLRLREAHIPLDVEVNVQWLTPTPEELSRVDCWPERFGGFDDPDKAKCLKRNCEWNDVRTHPDVPPCFFPSSNTGYVMSDQDLTPDGNNAYKTVLTRKGRGPFGQDLPSIVFRVEEYGENLLRFSFDTVNSQRFRPPVPLTLPTNSPTDRRKYSVNIDSRDPFKFSVYRLLSDGKRGEKIWSTVDGSLVFEDQFLQIANQPPSTYVYGLGENAKRTFKRDFSYQTYAIFSRDQMVGSIESLKRNMNHYGTQPFYTCMENDDNAHGVLFFNVDPQDYTMGPLPMITYRSIGGVLDFYLFMGPTPENVLQQYHQAIGKPIMPPYWGLGFALCKYGYNSLDNMKAAVDRTRDARIPLDILYGDIDHFDERRDFTYDKVAYKGLPDYFKDLRKHGMKTVIILDPAIVSNYSDYEPYNRLSAVDGNVHWSDDIPGPDDSKDKNNAMLGWVWPSGKTVYPDFFNNKTVQVWADLIVKYRNTMPFDALWIDMNEPTAFGTNFEKPFNWPEGVAPWSLKCPKSRYDDPPYRTGGSFMFDNADRAGRLSDKTICMSAVQGNNKEYRHYDVHGLYGHTQALATKVGLQQALGHHRGFIVTRSTFVGTGTTATHWLGDNASLWPDMALSIVGLMDFNLFGFPFTGSDICGHFGTAEPELCKRWMQLGAFYGFSRNHNAVGNRDQDPGSYDELIQRVSREAMETRYLLLPYLYTLYHLAHTQGGSVLRPLHHVFIDDLQARSISKQFMWGDGLLISPVLEHGETIVSTHFYLPGPAKWYDFYKGMAVSNQGKEWRSAAVSPDSRIPLHVKGGTVLPTQQPALNTTYSRLNPISVIFVLDQTYQATGSLFWDDGTSRDTFESGAYHMVKYEADGTKASAQITHRGPSSLNVIIMYHHFEIWGVRKPVASVNISVDGGKPVPVAFGYNSQSQKLRVMPKRLTLKSEFIVTWS